MNALENENKTQNSMIILRKKIKIDVKRYNPNVKKISVKASKKPVIFVKTFKR